MSKPCVRRDRRKLLFMETVEENFSEGEEADEKDSIH